MNCGFAIFDRLPVLAPYEANPRILSRIPGSSENLLGLKKWCPGPDLNRDKRFRKPRALTGYEGRSHRKTRKSRKRRGYSVKFWQEFSA
jgi:hypothetical protein